MASRPTYEHDLFLSYAREDADTARSLVSQLESNGIDVWWDSDLKAGQQFHEVILAKITASRKAAVLWSEHSINSAFVLDEANRALEQGKLIPITLDDTRPPLGFGAYQMLSMSAQQPDASMLIHYLGDEMSSFEQSSMDASETSTTRSKWITAAALLLPLMLIAGIFSSDIGRNRLTEIVTGQEIQGPGSDTQTQQLNSSDTSSQASNTTSGEIPATSADPDSSIDNQSSSSADPSNEVYAGPPVYLDNDYMNEFSALLMDHGLRRVSAGDLLELGAAHDDPSSACYQKNHVPPKHMWPNVLPLAKALESVRSTARTSIAVVSAYRSHNYNQCLNGEPDSRFLNFKAIGLRSSTLDPEQLSGAFENLKQNGEFTGLISATDNMLILELDP